ncbi:MAG: hypothetical protein H6709_18305 [Kofleriaceae bacterium]|nr:hypothetical protein [Kofleriaceae bacterium]MCB9574039.1 hypothetical protein [Kofleriaceae bacterium]
MDARWWLPRWRLAATTTLAVGVLGAACGDDAPGLAPPGPAPSCAGLEAGAWDPAFALPGLTGAGSQVDTLARGGDGALYAGGVFADAAGRAVRNVAMHDGADWAPLGDGLPGEVTRLVVDGDGVLWAAGHPLVDDGTAPYLARWDGATWTVVAEVAGASAGIDALAVVPGGLLAGGAFDGIGGVAAHGLARFDGATWSAAGDLGGDGAVFVGAIAVTGDGYCVGGNFDAIAGVAAGGAACWDGVAWTALGDQLPGTLRALAQGPDGTWYAGGSLFFDDGSNDVPQMIAYLDGDGAWQPLGGGLRGWFECPGEVDAIHVDGDDVVVAGTFTAAPPDLQLTGLARWRASDGWHAVASTRGVHQEPTFCGAGVRALLAADDDLIVGGRFASAGDVAAANVARIAADEAVTPLPSPRPTRGVTGADGPLVGAIGAGADGLVATGPLAIAGLGGDVPAARLDADGWHALAIDPAIVLREVIDVAIRPDGTYAIATQRGLWVGPLDALQPVPGTDLVTGVLATAGADLIVATNRRDVDRGEVLRWDGATLTSLGAFDDTVAELAWDGDAVLVAGDFHDVDGVAVDGFARYRDGAWSDPGFGAPFARPTALFRVATCDRGVVVGTLGDAAGVPVPLRFHDASGWHDLDGGRVHAAVDLAITDGALYVDERAPGRSAIAAWRFGP